MVTISTHSTFGLENLARYNKTAIFHTKKKPTKNLMNIFWNYNLSNKGLFWTDTINYKEINRVLDYLILTKNSMWKKKNKNLIKKLMFYNFGNKVLIKKIQSCL